MLGQLPDPHYPRIRDFLVARIEDEEEFPVVRHEAAEGLANYMRQEDLPLFARYRDSPVPELRDTCRVALEKVKHQALSSLYGTQFASTREPAAPYDPATANKLLAGRSL